MPPLTTTYITMQRMSRIFVNRKTYIGGDFRKKRSPPINFLPKIYDIIIYKKKVPMLINALVVVTGICIGQLRVEAEAKANKIKGIPDLTCWIGWT